MEGRDSQTLHWWLFSWFIIINHCNDSFIQLVVSCVTGEKRVKSFFGFLAAILIFKKNINKHTKINLFFGQRIFDQKIAKLVYLRPKQSKLKRLISGKKLKIPIIFVFWLYDQLDRLPEDR